LHDQLSGAQYDLIFTTDHPAEVTASGEEALRIRTEVTVSPFDDLMLEVAGKQAFAKVVECDTQDGVCRLFAVYTSVPAEVRRALAEVNEVEAVRP
jgi:adenylate cyclase